MTSSQQFLDNLATHLRITTGFTIPFDLKEHFSFTQLLVRTAQQTHQFVPPATQDDLGEGVVLEPLCHGTGVHDGLVGGSPCREGGARSGGRPYCAGLARVNDGSPQTRSSCARRSVSRSRKMLAAL